MVAALRHWARRSMRTHANGDSSSSPSSLRAHAASSALSQAVARCRVGREFSCVPGGTEGARAADESSIGRTAWTVLRVKASGDGAQGCLFACETSAESGGRAGDGD